MWDGRAGDGEAVGMCEPCTENTVGRVGSGNAGGK